MRSDESKRGDYRKRKENKEKCKVRFMTDSKLLQLLKGSALSRVCLEDQDGKQSNGHASQQRAA